MVIFDWLFNIATITVKWLIFSWCYADLIRTRLYHFLGRLMVSFWPQFFLSVHIYMFPMRAMKERNLNLFTTSYPAVFFRYLRCHQWACVRLPGQLVAVSELAVAVTWRCACIHAGNGRVPCCLVCFQPHTVCCRHLQGLLSTVFVLSVNWTWDGLYGLVTVLSESSKPVTFLGLSGLARIPSCVLSSNISGQVGNMFPQVIYKS